MNLVHIEQFEGQDFAIMRCGAAVFIADDGGTIPKGFDFVLWPTGQETCPDCIERVNGRAPESRAAMRVR